MGDIGTYPPQNVSAQSPVLAYAENSAAQTGITGLQIPLTGLSVTVTVPAGRRIQITGVVPQFSRTVGTTTFVDFLIKEGSTILNRSVESMPNTYTGATVSVVITPSAGTHTYYLAANPDASTTITKEAYLSYILVEDITGSQLPVLPQSVPVGVLGYGLSTISGFVNYSTETTVPGCTVNVVVPAGRTLRITAHAWLTFSTTTAVMQSRIREDGVDIGTLGTFATNTGHGFGHQGIVVRSPTAGAHTYSLVIQPNAVGANCNVYNAVATPTYIVVEDVTPTPAPGQGAPGSTLGYAEVTSIQSSITTVTDVTGLSVTFTVPAGRRIKATYQGAVDNSVAGAVMEVLLTDSANNRLQSSKIYAGVGNAVNQAFANIEHVATPAAGTYTWKIRQQRETGTGDSRHVATTTSPAFLLIEDITGAVWPVGSTVTAGMVASEEWAAWTPTLTNITLGSGTVVAKYQRVGRTVHWRFSFTFGAGSAIASGPRFTLPVAYSAEYLAWGAPIGAGYANDSGFGYALGVEATGEATNTTVRLQVFGASGPYTVATSIDSTVPFTWATGDRLSASGSYEAVS